jgi:hypothetical protein
MGSRQPVCFTVTLVRENRCRGFYRQGVGRLLESVIMYAVEVAAEHAVAADIAVPKKIRTTGTLTAAPVRLHARRLENSRSRPSPICRLISRTPMGLANANG